MDTDEPTISDAATAGGRQRIGQTLAAARAARKLPLEDIARDTRVPLRHLRAIEADAHDSLPALPYTIGFVKSFARAVGVDADAAAAQFRTETSKTAHVPTAVALEPLDERRLPPRWLVAASLAALLVLGAGVLLWSSGAFDPPVAPPPVVIREAAPAAAPATPPATATPQGGTPGVALAVPGGAPGVAPPLVPGGAPGVAVPPLAAGGGVVIVPTEDVWVKIYDAQRNTVKVGLLKAGERYDVPADPPGLKLWTGKAGVLQVSVGGRAIPPLGGPVETIKDVSLAPADLLARAAAAPASAATAPVPPAAAGPAVPVPQTTAPGPTPVTR